MKGARVLIVINSLGAGGAERVLSHVLAAAPSDLGGLEVALLDREPRQRSLTTRATIHELDCHGRLDLSARRLIGLVRRLKPDLIVSFLVRANIASIIAGRVVSIPVVTSERMHLSAHLREKHGAARAWLYGLAPRLFYPLAHHVIAVSQGVADDLIQRWGVPSARITVTPNPIDFAQMRSMADAAPEIPLPDRFMLAVGRMVAAKGYLELIDAYAKSAVDWPLIILGEGDQRATLEAARAQLGLETRVVMPGYIANPFAIMARAALYVSASHCEGFPNAMAEAMALGAPVVVTDCPSGPAEILGLRDGAAMAETVATPYGMLTPVGDVAAIATAISSMVNEERRRACAEAARQRALDFSADQASRNYWTVFERALGGPRPR